MRSTMNSQYVETDDGQVVFLDFEVCGEGGFGEVYRGHFDCSPTPVAVKFMRNPDVTGYQKQVAKEIAHKSVLRFEQEIALLVKLNDEVAGNPFVNCQGHGKWNGHPFYVMEWLEPVNLLTLETDDQRYKYAYDLCFAVLSLHEAGYVHYDIKPSNIMMREGIHGRKEYVLIDFGSVHAIETDDDEEKCSGNSVSMLSDGRRVYPHTPGYADPLEDRHTINADIYAIGQVFRDMFPEDVPAAWSRIIDKCISRSRDYRYTNVEEILYDLGRLKKTMYAFAASEDMRIWRAQKALMDVEQVEMSWWDFRLMLGAQRGLTLDKDYPDPPGEFSPVSELLIDFGKLKKRNIRITDPMHMTESGLLVIRGNGRISIDLDGTASSDEDALSIAEDSGWDEPIYPFVILLDGATLDNRTLLDNEEAQLMYIVGRYCLLNFSSRDVAAPADDPRFILKGRAGYSFVRNGKPSWQKGLYGILKDGNKHLFAQQKWDDLDVLSLLKTLRKIRRSSAPGNVQDWLENNVRSVLMRNLGRYGTGD